MSKYFIKTYGCQANKNESERIATYLEMELGLTETEDWREADFIVLNTCSVRKAADDRAYGSLREMNRYYSGERGGKIIARNIAKQKTAAENSQTTPKVGLTGCMSRYELGKCKEFLPILSETVEPVRLWFD